MTVEGILKRKGRGVVTIEGDSPVGDAICVMRHRSVGALVVRISLTLILVLPPCLYTQYRAFPPNVNVAAATM